MSLPGTLIKHTRLFNSLEIQGFSKVLAMTRPWAGPIWALGPGPGAAAGGALGPGPWPGGGSGPGPGARAWAWAHVRYMYAHIFYWYLCFRGITLDYCPTKLVAK